MNSRGDKKELLRPARLWFIIFSMFIALIINFIPLGKMIWRPDVLLVVLVYWSIHQPQKLSFLFAFCLGLAMDVHYGVVLGQHALVYVVACFIAVGGARRIVWFDLAGQMLHMFPVFLLAHVLLLIIFRLQGGVGFQWIVLLAPILETLLWVIVDFLLLRPQRSNPEKTGL